jgi:hypothetical protein
MINPVRFLASQQCAPISDSLSAKIAMVVAVFEATLCSLKRDRIERLGGIQTITLYDLSREFREGAGDVGICFEYAVHEAIRRNDPFIVPLASEVLEDHCHLKGGVQSLLFGPEKDGVVPVTQSVMDSLTDDSILHLGLPGKPPKLKRHIPMVVEAFRSEAAREILPRSIKGLWKADLFLGNSHTQTWVATTVKINQNHLERAAGLRIGIYPKKDGSDSPRVDEGLNLVRLPLPYDQAFMELFYKAFFLARAFMRADARVPRPVDLPDSEDRFCTEELEKRRLFAVVEALPALRKMAQPGLLAPTAEVTLPSDVTISIVSGLSPVAAALPTGLVSVAPVACGAQQ